MAADIQGALQTREQIQWAVESALEQIAPQIRGDYTVGAYEEILGMAVHDATTCLAELLPTGHES